MQHHPVRSAAAVAIPPHHQPHTSARGAVQAAYPQLRPPPQHHDGHRRCHRHHPWGGVGLHWRRSAVHQLAHGDCLPGWLHDLTAWHQIPHAHCGLRARALRRLAGLGLHNSSSSSSSSTDGARAGGWTRGGHTACTACTAKPSLFHFKYGADEGGVTGSELAVSCGAHAHTCTYTYMHMHIHAHARTVWAHLHKASLDAHTIVGPKFAALITDTIVRSSAWPLAHARAWRCCLWMRCRRAGTAASWVIHTTCAGCARRQRRQHPTARAGSSGSSSYCYSSCCGVAVGPKETGLA
jgi:hypothetical protein